MKILKKLDERDSQIRRLSILFWGFITAVTLMTSPFQLFIPGIPLAIAVFSLSLSKKNQILVNSVLMVPAGIILVPFLYYFFVNYIIGT